jgi:hypothetical protein
MQAFDYDKLHSFAFSSGGLALCPGFVAKLMLRIPRGNRAG